MKKWLEANPILVYLIFGGELHDPGGWAKYVKELADFLENQGYKVKIVNRLGKISSSGASFTIVNKADASYRKITLSYLINHFPNPLTVILGILALIKEFKRARDLVKMIHVHDLSSSILIAFFIWRFFKIPYIIQIHGFPFREWKIKLLQTNSFLGRLIWFLTKILHVISLKLIVNSSALVLVNSDEVRSFYNSYGIPLNKLVVVPSAINLQKHEKGLLPRNEARKYLGVAGLNDICICYVGRLTPEKNLETLLEAFSEFINYTDKRAKLVIIGDGPLRSKLEKCVKERGINSCVHFSGYVRDAYKFLSGVDIFVLPSLSEGSPFSLIEAMVAGKAIIASDIPAIRGIVEDGKEALLFDPHNPQQLKELMLKLYRDKELKRRLEENARQKAKQYDANIVFSKILQIYKEVLRISSNSG
ncbi:MAG: glycosyltransferase family 4 protein [Candidatus Baldrarchaeia archaeon]